MKIKALAMVVGAVLAAAPAIAQQTAKFAKIDCATSPLRVPPNLICLASNEVAGGDFGGGSAGGLFKYWNAIGKVGALKAYVYGAEALDARSEVRITQALRDAVDVVTPYAKPASHFSDMKRVGDADTVAYRGGDGDSCAIVRKVGPARQTGYRWVAFGLLCGPAGKPPAENELSSFITNVGFR